MDFISNSGELEEVMLGIEDDDDRIQFSGYGDDIEIWLDDDD